MRFFLNILFVLTKNFRIQEVCHKKRLAVRYIYCDDSLLGKHVQDILEKKHMFVRPTDFRVIKGCKKLNNQLSEFTLGFICSCDIGEGTINFP